MGEADLAMVTETGKSAFKCDSCTKALGSSNEKTPAKSQGSHSSSNEEATSSPSPTKEVFPSTIATVST
jgi:hypothetical protein